MPQIRYCSLVSINHGETLENQIKRLHKRELTLGCNDYSLRFSAPEKDLQLYIIVTCRHWDTKYSKLKKRK